MDRIVTQKAVANRKVTSECKDCLVLMTVEETEPSLYENPQEISFQLRLTKIPPKKMPWWGIGTARCPPDPRLLLVGALLLYGALRAPFQFVCNSQKRFLNQRLRLRRSLNLIAHQARKAQRPNYLCFRMMSLTTLSVFIVISCLLVVAVLVFFFAKKSGQVYYVKGSEPVIDLK